MNPSNKVLLSSLSLQFCPKNAGVYIQHPEVSSMGGENNHMEQLLDQTTNAVVKLTEGQNALTRNNEGICALLNESRIQHREQILTLKSTIEKRFRRVEAVMEHGMSYLQGQINTLSTKVNSIDRKRVVTSPSNRHDDERVTETNYGPLKRTFDGKLLCNFCGKPLSYPYVIKHMDENICGGR